ncbi:MAG: hypothetical protein ACYC6L_08615 [Anaerolineae bacterium]
MFARDDTAGFKELKTLGFIGKRRKIYRFYSKYYRSNEDNEIIFEARDFGEILVSQLDNPVWIARQGEYYWFMFRGAIYVDNENLTTDQVRRRVLGIS